MNTIDLQSQIYASTTEDDVSTVLKVHLQGGSLAKLNIIEKIFPHVYIFIPILYLWFNWATFKDRNYKDATTLSSLGYGISS